VKEKKAALGAGLPTSPTVRRPYFAFLSLPAKLVFIPEG
jgi:hypothetical protein